MKKITKIISVLMISTLFMTYFVGCQKKSGNEVPETTTKQETTTEPEATQVVPGKESPKNENPIFKELAVNYNNNSLQLYDYVDTIKLEKIFGKMEEEKSHTYAADDGLNMDFLIGLTNKEYKFSGLIIEAINTLEEKDKFYVHKIKISDQKYSTPKNIKINDSVSMLKEQYPKATPVPGDDGENYLYRPVDHFDTMEFKIKDDKVSSIVIYSSLD